MITRRAIPAVVFCALTCMLLAGAGGPALAKTGEAGKTEGISSLPPAAQASISGVLGRDDHSYHVVREGKGLHTENQKHRLSANFTSQGVQVRSGRARWGLTFSSYGYGDKLRPLKAVAPEAAANRVEYRRGTVTEWYVNGPVGLEQGFTLSQPPAERRNGPLTLGLRLSGDLTASVDPLQDGLTLRQDGRMVLHYRGLTAFDAAGKPLHAWMQATGDRLLLRVDDAGASYPITVDPFVQTAKLTASDGASYDNFGMAVAVNNDTLVVGSPFATDSSNTDKGAVYVFVNSGSGWTETARLTASDGESSDLFGWSVAFSGDAIVVGAYRADIGNNTSQGAAYVFVKPVSGWASMTETAKLTASDGATYDHFGVSVAISGDTVVVGARAADIGSNPHQGAAYMFEKPVSGWSSMTETGKLTASDGVRDDDFGYSVAISGNTVVVGAPEADIVDNTGNHFHKGAAYIFEKSGSGWIETAKLTVSGSDGVTHYVLFGWSVAISGDTVVVGAPQAMIGIYIQGAAYVFMKPSSGWTGMTETAKLTASDGVSGDSFGASVAIRGDRAVVGTLNEGFLNDKRGAMYVFEKPPGGWISTTETEKLTASDGAPYDYFGYSVAISGDRAVAGAIGADIGNNRIQGAAYVFTHLNTSTCTLPTECPDGVAVELTPLHCTSGGESTLSETIEVTFFPVEVAGQTTACYVPAVPTGCPGSENFEFDTLALDVCYDVSTTAEYGPPVTVCFTLTGEDTSAFTIGHDDPANGWDELVDDCDMTITTDCLIRYPETETIETICAKVDSLSWFVIVLDTTAPAFTLETLKDSLWPPNHKLVHVATVKDVSDAVDPSPAVDIQITSSDPANGKGDGNTAQDWEVRKVNDTWEVWVRAERPGKGKGRIYTISATVTDASGNAAAESHTVTVPHDKGRR